MPAMSNPTKSPKCHCLNHISGCAYYFRQLNSLGKSYIITIISWLT